MLTVGISLLCIGYFAGRLSVKQHKVEVIPTAMVPLALKRKWEVGAVMNSNWWR